MEAVPCVVGTTTCTQKGYGYGDAILCPLNRKKKDGECHSLDSSVTQSGAWTDTFLVQGLQGQQECLDLVELYENCRAKYQRQYQSRGDWPCFFANDGAVSLNTNDQSNCVLPRARFIVTNYL